MIVKIVLIVSLVLNSALLIAVLGAFPFFLYISLLVNVALGWYIANLLEDLSEVNDDLEDLFETTSSLQNHIESIHELEMFYGDQTLEELILHTKDVVSDIEFYKEKYSTDLEEEELDDGRQETEEE